jgi:hypothetical protein
VAVTLEEMNYVVQMAANVAVIASLVFVVFQVRMGLRMMRDQAARNHNEKVQSISRAMFENADLADLWARCSSAGMVGLTDGERVRFVNFYTYALRVWEELFIQHRNGIMDVVVWKANMRILRDTRPLPGAKEVWAIRRHLFTPDFQAFYEAEVPGEEARPLYDVDPTAA